MKILISGYYGYKNIGDEAILSCILGDLRKQIPNLDITIASDDPQYTENLHKTKSVGRNDLVALVKEIEKVDLIILGGGGLFQDHDRMKIHHLFQRGVDSPTRYLIVPLIAKIMNKKLIYYAHGVGPLFSKEAIDIVKFAYNLPDLITVRDSYSFHLLSSLGIKTEKLYLTADPVFGIASCSSQKIEEILKHNVPKGKKFFVVSPRPWVHNKKLEIQYVSALKVFINEFCRYYTEWHFLFIPFHISETTGGDLEIAQAISTEASSYCSILTCECNPQEIAGIISKADLVLE